MGVPEIGVLRSNTTSSNPKSRRSLSMIKSDDSEDSFNSINTDIQNTIHNKQPASVQRTNTREEEKTGEARQSPLPSVNLLGQLEFKYGRSLTAPFKPKPHHQQRAHTLDKDSLCTNEDKTSEDYSTNSPFMNQAAASHGMVDTSHDWNLGFYNSHKLSAPIININPS